MKRGEVIALVRALEEDAALHAREAERHSWGKQRSSSLREAAEQFTAALALRQLANITDEEMSDGH